MDEIITSPKNPKIQLIQKLRDKKWRQREKQFVIDDVRDLMRAVQLGSSVSYILYSPSLLDEAETKLITTSTAPVFEIPTDTLKKISYRENPSGIIAVLNEPSAPKLVDLHSEHVPTILALVGLTKPGNIGALLRTADATGIQAVFLVDIDVDLYNPNIIRASTGACFRNNVYHTTTHEAQQWFLQHKYHVVALHLEGKTDLFDVDFSQKTALVLGTEDTGLSNQWVTGNTILTKIPMQSEIVDSLNVSVTGAICMFEALRQRNNTSESSTH